MSDLTDDIEEQAERAADVEAQMGPSHLGASDDGDDEGREGPEVQTPTDGGQEEQHRQVWRAELEAWSRRAAHAPSPLLQSASGAWRLVDSLREQLAASEAARLEAQAALAETREGIRKELDDWLEDWNYEGEVAENVQCVLLNLGGGLLGKEWVDAAMDRLGKNSGPPERRRVMVVGGENADLRRRMAAALALVDEIPVTQENERAIDGVRELLTVEEGAKPEPAPTYSHPEAEANDKDGG